MTARKSSDSEAPHIPAPRAAITPDDREKQLTNAAYDLAEKQILAGEASSQVITHFLKAGSSRERLEHAKMLKDLELADAKIEQMQQNARLEELLGDAIDAMRSYAPGGEIPDFHDLEISEKEFDGN
jgi:hypothetical protein